MDENSKCEDCKFWSDREHQIADWGHCRRFPPTFIPKKIRDENIEKYSEHPQTFCEDKCGEWKNKTERVTVVLEPPDVSQ